MPTRMPTSRADSGLAAAARIASPTRVYLKNANNSTRTTNVITIMPAWCAPIRPSPKSDALPNGLGNGLIVKSQMKPARLLKIANSAMKTTMWLSTGAFSIGLKTVRSMMKPPTKEMPIVRTNASQ